MSLAADLVTLLNASSTVTNLVVINNKTGTKAIRPEKLSQNDVFTGSLGGIEIHTVSTDYENDLGGSGKTAWVKILVDCVTLASLSANNLADKVIAVLEPFRGATAGGFIDGIELLDRKGEWTATDDGRETGEYVVEVELHVFYVAN
jgi:hypothetical protein